MSASKYLELAVVLKAVDQMSGTVRNALGGAAGGYANLANSKERADASMRKGLVLGAGAKMILDKLSEVEHKYGDVQEAQEDLRVSMLKPGGGIDEKMFSRYIKLSEQLSAKYAGSQMDYVNMERAMRENRLEGEDILGGTGVAVAELSELFKTLPAESAIFAARVKNDLKVPANEMIRMVDLLARLKQVGVGHTGSETISNMTEFYSKAGMGATNLGMKGSHDAMELGALGAMFIAKGQDAPSVGTTFRRIFDNISIPHKFKEMNEEAAKFGKHLEFFDKAGNFKGVQNFVAQLSTLHGLSTSAISQILGPAGSAQGMSGDVLKSIALFGKEDYQNFLARIADQADITQKVAEQQRGWNQQTRITLSNIENLEANIGKSYNPLVMWATKLTGGWANSLSHVVADHQTVTGTAAGITIAAAAAMALGSAIHFIGAAWTYSKIPLLLSSIAGSSAWTALTMGARGFGLVLTDIVGPAIAGVITGLTGMTVAAAAGVVALGAAVVGGMGYVYYDNIKKSNESLRASAAHDLQDEFDKKTNFARYLQGVNLPTHTVDMKQSASMIKLNDMLRKDPVARVNINNNTRPVVVPDHKPVHVNYNPVIHVSADVDIKGVKQILNENGSHLIDLLNKQNADAERRKY